MNGGEALTLLASIALILVAVAALAAIVHDVMADWLEEREWRRRRGD
jgi:hypothetical protein